MICQPENVVVLLRKDQTAEYDCRECGVRVFAFAPAHLFPLCAICCAMPGWQAIPDLVAIFRSPDA